MTTYSNPYSFCRLVIELLEERRWRVYEDKAQHLFRLPDGTTGQHNDQKTAFREMCQAFCKRYNIPIAWDPSKINPVPKKPPTMKVNWDPAGSDDIGGFHAFHFPRTTSTANAPDPIDFGYSHDKLMRDMLRDLLKRNVKKSGGSIFDHPA